MYIAHNKVRMHDTDTAGILYFARQFRFAHDALEDMVESEGLSFEKIFHKNDFVFVIVHAEADYLAPLRLGDRLEVHVTVERIGSSSFTMNYAIHKEDGPLVGTAKTVHVTLSRTTREKIPIPDSLKPLLEKHVYTS